MKMTLVDGRFSRILEQRSGPLRRGSTESVRSRSIGPGCIALMACAASPSAASSTVNPWLRSARPTYFRMLASSSTTRTVPVDGSAAGLPARLFPASGFSIGSSTRGR
jgi:hypothetical protein